MRNHITRVFDKIGVEHRYEAIVRARDAGLGVAAACQFTLAGTFVPGSRPRSRDSRGIGLNTTAIARRRLAATGRTPRARLTVQRRTRCLDS